MLIRIALIIVLIGCLGIKNSIAQINTDTLNRIYSYMKNYDYSKADLLLVAYEQEHPNHPDALRLHAQLYAFMGKTTKAEKLYENLLNEQPNNYSLRCEYAEMLMGFAQYKEAQQVLNPLLESNPPNVNALYLNAKMAYWEGNPKLALQILRVILKKDKNDVRAKQLSDEVKLSMAPRFSYQPLYYADNQIVTGFTNAFSIGASRSSYFNPGAELLLGNYYARNQTTYKFSLLGTQTFLFSRAKLSWDLKTGVFMNVAALSTTSKWLWATTLKKQLLPHTTLELNAERKPYTYNINSIISPILQTEGGVALIYQKDKGIQAKAAYQLNAFDDQNQVSCFYAWGLYPAYINKGFEVYLGYGFNYSNSQQSRWISSDSLSTVLVNYTGGSIEGMYSPYFTPLKQTIHSLITTITYQLNKQSKLFINLSYGIQAQAQIPYLFLLNNDLGQTVFASGTAPMNFHPIDASVKWTYKVNKLTDLYIGIGYMKNNFYSNQLIKAGFNKILYGKKR